MTGPATVLSATATSHLGLRVPDVEATVRFYERILGLSSHGPLSDGGVRLGWGRGHHVLDLLPGDGGLDHFAFEVGVDADAFDARRLNIERLGAITLDLDASMTGAAGFSTTDPDGHVVQFHRGVDRSGEVGDPSARRPIRYQHITLATSAVPAMLEFYTAVIGFQQSDVMGENEFTWLRSNREHHTLALVSSPSAGDVDHFAFDVTGWDELKTWCDRLTDEGVDVTWGPGRHGPGNNLFVFFDDPAGNHIELSAELERFHDDRVAYPVRRWEPVPGSPNLWGGQLPQFRTLSQGI
jgi:catechol 2,3-dioxygenase